MSPRMIPKAKMSVGTAEAEVMQPYSGAVQALHWAMGGGILACFGTVQLAQRSKGKEKGMYMMYHKSFALLVAAALPVRLGLRLASKMPKAVPGNTLEVMAGKASHAAMYGFMVFMPVSGIAMGYYGGKGLPFFGYTIPGAETPNGEIAKNAYKYHKQFGLYFEYLFLAHIGAVGFHLVKGQNILARMLPIFKTP